MKIGDEANGGREPQSLTDVVDGSLENAEGQDKVSVHELLDAFSGRVYGPLLLIPGLMITLPIIGAIPGVPIFFGALAALVSVQLLFGRSYPWVPNFMLRRELPGDKVTKALERSRPWAMKVDRWIRPRLTLFTHRPMPQLVALICIGLAASTVPLAVVPWGVAAPGLALSCFGLALTARDGVLVLAGLTFTAATVAVAAMFAAGAGG